MAKTTQKVECLGVALKDIGSEIAAQLASTGKWAVVVDNYSAGGFTIIESVQEYQYKTASAPRVDNGTTWQADGKPFRYEYPTETGKEKLYIKILPFYDSNGNHKGFSFAMSNMLNAGRTDFYEPKTTSSYSATNKYIKGDGTILDSNPNTSNYMKKPLATAELQSPTNSNYNYYPIVECYQSFKDPATHKVTVWLQVVSDTRADDAENGDRCDMIFGVIKGIDVDGMTNFFHIGVPQAISKFVAEGWGVARSIVGTTSNQGSRQYSCVGVLGGGSSYQGVSCPCKGGTAPHQHNTDSIYPQYTSMCYLAAGTVHSGSYCYALCHLMYQGYNGQNATYNYVGHAGGQSGQCRDFTDYVEGANQNGYFMYSDYEMYVYPYQGYYYYIGSSGTQTSNRYAYKPHLKIPTEGLFLFVPNQYMHSWLGSNGETGDVMEYDGKRWLMIIGVTEKVGQQTSNYQRTMFMFLENVT